MAEQGSRVAGPDEETVKLADLPSPGDVAGELERRRRRRRLRRRLRRWLPWTALVLVVVLLAAAVWVVFYSSLVTARTVAVGGPSDLSKARIRQVADVPVGTPLARVDLDAIRRRVDAIPAVASTEVSRAWPHTVRITVTERVPVAAVERGNGLVAVDATGHTFFRYAQRPSSLPLVKTEGTPSRAALAEAGKVAGALPRGLAAKANYVEVQTVDDITVVLHDGRTVTWGSADDSALKAKVAAVLLARKGVLAVDVSVPERPTTRP